MPFNSNKHKKILFYQFLNEYNHYQQLGFDFLKALYDIQKSGKFSWIDDLLRQITLGFPLLQSLDGCKKHFHPLDYAYLCICLRTNTLNQFIPRYLATMQQNHLLKTKIMQKAFYPLLLFSLSTLLSLMMHFFLSPAYASLGNNFGLAPNKPIQWQTTLQILILAVGLIAHLIYQFPLLKTKILPFSLELEVMHWAQTIELGVSVHLALIDCLMLIESHLQLKHLKAFNQAWIFYLRQGCSHQEALVKAPKILKEAFLDYRENPEFFKTLSQSYQIKFNTRLNMIERYLQPGLLTLAAFTCLGLFYRLYQPLFNFVITI